MQLLTIFLRRVVSWLIEIPQKFYTGSFGYMAMTKQIVEAAVAAMILAVCLGAAVIILGANAGVVSGLITVIVKLAAAVAVIGVFAAAILSFARAVAP